MQIAFLATVSVIAADPPATSRLYGELIGLALAGEGEYRYTETLAGVKHFGVWPLSQAAEACFGVAEWPEDTIVPQVSIEFDVAGPDEVDGAARELEAAGCELLHPVRVEPWGQTVVRLLSPEGSIVGVSYTPALHDGAGPPSSRSG